MCVPGCFAPYDSWANRIAVDRFVQDIPFTPRHPTWQVLERVEAGLGVAGQSADSTDLGDARLVLSSRMPRPVRAALAACGSRIGSTTAAITWSRMRTSGSCR